MKTIELISGYLIPRKTFGIVSKNTIVTTSTCRDTFHNQHYRKTYPTWDSKTRRYRNFRLKRSFVFGVASVEQTEKYIHEIESILKLKKKSKFSKVHFVGSKNGRPRVAFIEPSAWWFKDYLRFSLFSLLIRSSVYQKSLEQEFSKGCENQEAGLLETKRFVKFFLAGNTLRRNKLIIGRSYRHSMNGWVDSIRGRKDPAKFLKRDRTQSPQKAVCC